MTLHVDYRNHAASDDDPSTEVRLRLGYTEDVINAVRSLRQGPAFVDDDRIGLLDRSMGGGVVLNVLVVRRRSGCGCTCTKERSTRSSPVAAVDAADHPLLRRAAAGVREPAEKSIEYAM